MDNNLGFYLEENNLVTYYLPLQLATIIFGVAFLLLSIKLFSPKSKFNYVGPVLGTLGIIWIILIGVLAASASRFNFDTAEIIKIMKTYRYLLQMTPSMI
jgi:uncharacterized membrane protein YidH (DUF202 family)